MQYKTLAAAILALPAVSGAVNAPRPHTCALVVRETAGIRRFNFPVSGTVELAQGDVRDEQRFRLLRSGDEVPVQVTAESHWPDGSIRMAAVNFNASLAPLEELRQVLEFGDEVRAQPITTERLEVRRTPEGIDVGKFRFGVVPLLRSAAFGRENLLPDFNGFLVRDADGVTRALGTPARIDVLRSGPLFVRIRYEGTIERGADRLPYALTIDVPNSKSWVRLALAVDDARQRTRAVSFVARLALREYPWTWDFGTGSWSYGALRGAQEGVALRQDVEVSGRGTGWEILTGAAGELRSYERAAGDRPARAEGWGHVQDAERVVAFAVERFAREQGTYRLELDGTGRLEVGFSDGDERARQELAVYLHFVSNPTPVGAATSPVSMATPPEVRVEAR